MTTPPEDNNLKRLTPDELRRLSIRAFKAYDLRVRNVHDRQAANDATNERYRRFREPWDRMHGVHFLLDLINRTQNPERRAAFLVVLEDFSADDDRLQVAIERLGPEGFYELYASLPIEELRQYCELAEIEEFPEFPVHAYRPLGYSPPSTPPLEAPISASHNDDNVGGNIPEPPVGDETLADALAHYQTYDPFPEQEPSASTLGSDLASGEPIVLADGDRTRHVCVIGKTGYGKSTLLEHLIVADLRSGISAILIDPDGDLSNRIITLATEEERERITLLEVWPDRPFRLNLLACPDEDTDRTVGSILTLFKRLFNAESADYAPRLERFLGNALRTLIPNGGTLADVPRLFLDREYRDGLLASVRNPTVHSFWQWYDKLKPIDQTMQLESTVNRLNEFLSSETAYAMVSAQETTAPLDEVLSSDGHVLLIRIPTGKLSEKYARFYGALFLNLLTDRLFARSELPPSQRHRLHLYLDEYGWFATSTTAAILQQARKYNLGATIAFQTLADLPDEKNKQAALQVGAFIILRLTGQNADELVSEFPVIPRQETIEESIGFRKITTISHDPVAHLLEHPHSNREATHAVTAFLRPLHNLRADATKSGKVWPPLSANSKWPLSSEPAPSDLQQVLGIIDQLLLAAMERQEDLTVDALALMAAEALLKLGACHYYHYTTQPAEVAPSVDEAREFERPGIAPRLAEQIKQAAQRPDPTSYFAATRQQQADAYESTSPWYALMQAAEQNLRQALTINGQLEGHSLTYIYDRLSTIRRELLVPIQRLEDDAAHLIILCRILAVEPIVVPTGQEKEEVRGRVHIQTFADARIELAGVLANLKAYTAYYQIRNEFGQVALAKPLLPAGMDEDAIRRVRERSKNRYGVPLDRPETVAPPAPPGPRISRRSRT